MKWVVIAVVLLGVASMALAKPSLEGLLQELSKIEHSEHHTEKKHLLGCEGCRDNVGTTDTHTYCADIEKKCDEDTLHYCDFTCGKCSCPATSSTKRGAAAAETNLKDLLKTLLKAAEKTEDNELERLQREQEKADDEYVANTLYRLTRSNTLACGDCRNEIGYKQGHVTVCARDDVCQSETKKMCKATCHEYFPECTCDRIKIIDTATGQEVTKRNLGEAETKKKLLAAFKEMLKNL